MISHLGQGQDYKRARARGCYRPDVACRMVGAGGGGKVLIWARHGVRYPLKGSHIPNKERRIVIAVSAEQEIWAAIPHPWNQTPDPCLTHRPCIAAMQSSDSFTGRGISQSTRVAGPLGSQRAIIKRKELANLGIAESSQLPNSTIRVS